MKLPNDKNINQWFENQEIQPSPQAWDTLAQLLDEQLPVQPIQSLETKISNKNKSNQRPILLWFASAAVIALFCGIGFTILNQDQQPNQVVTHVKIKEPANNLDNEIIKDKEFTIDSKNVYTKAEDNLHHINKGQMLIQQSFGSNAQDVMNTVNYLNNQDSIIVNPILKNNNTIQIAWEPIKTSQIKINTNNLLQSVESELIQEHVEKKLNTFQQIKVAIINRNIQE